jgi:arylsulfatase A-like enzyme
MKARSTLLLVLLCLLDACTNTPRPNIILITIDTLRADHVGAYDYAEGATPAMDDLEEQGGR